MRIQRCGHNDVDGTFCLVYDETKSNEVEERQKCAERLDELQVPAGLTRDQLVEQVFKYSQENAKSIWGRAAGHPTLVEVQIRVNGTIDYAFHADRYYTEAELKQVIRKAKSLRARIRRKAKIKRKV